MLALIVDGADVYDYVAGVEDGRVSGTFNVCYTASVVERHATSLV